MAKRRRSSFKPLVPPGRAPTQAAAPVTSLKLARKLTSKFHALLNEQTATKAAQPGSDAAARAARLARIDAEMKAMGGREAYQEASALSTSHFRSSRVVFKTCVRLGLQPAKGAPRLKVRGLCRCNDRATLPLVRRRAWLRQTDAGTGNIAPHSGP